MISDYAIEQKVIKYALENSYTLIANTNSSLQYIKVINNNKRQSLKWSKGTSFITLTENNISKKLSLNKLEDKNYE